MYVCEDMDSTMVFVGSGNAAAAAASAAAARYAASQGVSPGTTPGTAAGAAGGSPAGTSASPGTYSCYAFSFTFMYCCSYVLVTV